jgi:hypothetical protein
VTVKAPRTAIVLIHTCAAHPLRSNATYNANDDNWF